jgi:tRNA modification GTPase
MSGDSPLLLIELTPPGRGAVASLRIEGHGALDLVGRHIVTRSGRSLADFPPRRIVIGQLDRNGEEVVISRHSDTAIELHCHGGLAAVARIKETFVAEGCRQLAWRQWATSHETDPFAAAARLALAEARTAPASAILLDQYRGALRRAIEKIESALQSGDSAAAREQIHSLLMYADTGLHLVRPWQVVVAGRPNVGKSSLINAIAGYRRAIVHSTPGTTRDVLAMQTAMGGWPVEISDTAGLRETQQEIEQVGIELAGQKIDAANLVVLVFDRSLPWGGEDQALVESYPAALRVYNKSDLPGPSDQRPPGMEICAIHSIGIDDLCNAIAHRLVPNPPPPGAAVPFEPEQIEQIRGYLKQA